MSKFTSMPCAACGHRFAGDDDVVVCPVCGSPHHRSCFRNQGHCANEDKHESGYEWSAPNAAPKDVAICPHCNAANPKQAQTCQICGMPVHGSGTPQAQYEAPTLPGGYAPPQGYASYGEQAGEPKEIGGVTTREIAAYVGPNSPHYLHNFKKLAGQKGSLTWNWAAFLLTYFHFLYRRMYAAGTAVLCFSMLSNIALTFSVSRVFGMEYVLNPELLFTEAGLQKAEQIMPILMFVLIVQMVMRILCGLFMNRIYYNKALGDIRKTRETMDNQVNSRDYYAALFYNGSPNMRSIMIALLLHMCVNYLANELLKMIL